MTSTALPGAAHDAANGHSRISRIFNHGHQWGALTTGFVDRAGGSRSELIVFPPGISSEQRHALRFRRQWLLWGIIVWFFVAVALGSVMNGWAAVAIGAALYVGVLLAANARAGQARHGTVVIRAQVLNLMGHKEAFGDLELLERSASRLIRLDELAAAGGIDPVEYELRWGEVYRDILEQQPNHVSR